MESAINADLKELEVSIDQGIAQVKIKRVERRNALSQSLMREMIQCAARLSESLEVQVVILRGDGPCFSAGASADLRFGFPIARTLGNTLSIGNFKRLVAIFGVSRVKELIFTARFMKADEALALGFLSEVVSSADELLPKARALADLMAAHAPLTLMACKEALRRMHTEGGEADDQDLLMQIYASEDFREGMKSFLEKRTPQWKAR